MLDFLNCTIDKVAIHHIGNKTNGEEIKLSQSSPDISDERLRELLMKYFLGPFTNAEFHSFTSSNADFTENILFNCAADAFKDGKTFQKNSISIAKHLYDCSEHPQIKPGDLFVACFSNI